jgi:hypothetical protein
LIAVPIELQGAANVHVDPLPVGDK